MPLTTPENATPTKEKTTSRNGKLEDKLLSAKTTGTGQTQPLKTATKRKLISSCTCSWCHGQTILHNVIFA